MALALLIPGGTGQLGRELAARAPEGADVRAPGSADLDITNAGAVVEAVKSLAGSASLPPVVINAAAYTAVDAAEEDTNRAFAVNADGPRVLAAACSAHDVPLIHVSTDYVFPGDADRPYETDDELGPRSVYGVTKAAGEEAVLGSGARAWVVRTAWVYGAYGANFVKTMAKLAESRDSVSVVDDQRGSPTYVGHLAEATRAIVELPFGVYHVAAGGDCTWADFAEAIFEEAGLACRVRRITTSDFGAVAPRPAYSVLRTERGAPPLPHWRDGLRDCLRRLEAVEGS